MTKKTNGKNSKLMEWLNKNGALKILKKENVVVFYTVSVAHIL